MAPKSKELTASEKERIVTLFDSGFSRAEVCKVIGRPSSTVYHFIKRYVARGSIENKPRSGRPSDFKERDARLLQRCARNNREDTLVDITKKFNEARQRPFSKWTVHRKLKSLGINKRTQRKKLSVTEVNRKKRVSWCL
jgi:transposase